MKIEQIAAGVERLQQTFASGKTRSLVWRVEQLQQIKAMTLAHEQQIMQALEKDLSKGEMESWSSEISYVTGDIDHTIKHLKQWAKPRKVPTPIVAQPGKSYQQPEPLGVALIIGAWNYPYQLVLAPLSAAIAAGNCAVLKPSELSPHTSALLAELVPQYLDPQAFMVVEGAVEETTELLKQRFDHILYTGGEAVGKIVMRAAAEYLTPVTLELGGKSPCIVDSNTNLDVTVSRIAWSKWMNAGQTCVAPDYVLVEEAFAQQFIQALQAKITSFYGADIINNKDYGRIINQRHHARISSYLEGQNVIYGGQSDAEQNFLAPTLVLNPSWDSALMQNEIFGPVLPIITVKEINQAIPLINARPKPLALYLFTHNNQLEQQVLNNTSAGNVCVNDGMMFMANADLPFGGVGNSGMGSYCGKSGFDTFSHLKSVMKRSFFMDVDLRYPPYTEKKLKLLKMLR